MRYAVNDIVEVLWADGEWYVGEITSITQNGRARVEFDDGTESLVLFRDMRRHIGRRSLCEQFSVAEIKEQVSELLNELRDASSEHEKQRIRRALRRRGHFISQQGGHS